MRNEPVKIDEFKGCYCSSNKGSRLLRWYTDCKESPDIQVPSLLAKAVVDKDGKEIKTVEEWDDWWGENFQAGNELFSQCVSVVSTIEEAKKK